MATSRISSLSGTFFATTTKQTLTSLLFPRSFTTSSPSLSLFSSLSRLRPLAAVVLHHISPALTSSSVPFRTFSTRTSLNDNNTNWSNRSPKETILLDGCDFEHWLVVTEPPPEGATRDEIIDSYIKTLAQVVGSEEKARMKIYSVSTRCYFAFGALVSEELSYKLKELSNVRWVLPDSYLDVKNKDYGGEPFIDGQAVPYDPKYHEEWIRNNQKAMERNRRNDRPRNADRSRNFERRQRNQGPNNIGGPPNIGGMPPNQPGGAPNSAGYGQHMPPNKPGGAPNNAGYGQNMPPDQPGGAPNNAGYGHNMPPNQPGGSPYRAVYGQNMPPNQPGGAPNNAGYGQNMPPNQPGGAPNNAGYGQNMPPNNAGYGQKMPPNNAGYGQNMPPNNAGYVPGNAPNRGGMPPPSYGGQGNPGYQNKMPNYQNTQMQTRNPQSNYAPRPQGNMEEQQQQGQDVPGRDMPQYQ